MLIVLSPAKSLDLATPPSTTVQSTPAFLARSSELIDLLRRQAPHQIASLMGISDTLSALNVARYASWTADPKHGRQAIMAFNGEAYTAFDARSLKPKQLDYAQSTVRILSGLYGVLRPLDLIEPHRLEMGTRLPNARGKDLYAFWGDTVTLALNEAAAGKGAKALVNLASEEYFKSVKPALLSVPVVTPVFEDWKDGKFKVISFFAKRARGMMARYAAVKAVAEPEALKAFDGGGYRFDQRASSCATWVFRRKLEA